MIITTMNLTQIKKEAAKPMLGTFYVLGNAIYYSTLGDGGLAHANLWPHIVNKSGLFDSLVYENRRELAEAIYATDRGRVTWHGELKADGSPDLSNPDGYFILLGTKGSEEHKKLIKTIFGIRNIKQEVQEDWKTDTHYRVNDKDKKVLEDMIRLLGDKAEKPKTTHIAKVLENPYKNKVRRILNEINRETT